MTTTCQVAREQSDGSCVRVNFDVIGLGGDLAVARDVGQPNAEILQAGGDSSGRELPRAQSDLSGGDTIVVVGELHGSNAYSDAKTIVDDIVKPFIPAQDDAGNDLARGKVAELGIDFHGGQLFGAEVGFPGDQALALDYQPGYTNKVTVRLVASVVSCLNLGGASNPVNPVNIDGADRTFNSDHEQTIDRIVDLTDNISESGGVHVRADDGSKMFVLDVSDNTLHEYDLNTAYEPLSASHVTSADLSTLTGIDASGLETLAFKPDGTKFYSVDLSDSDVESFTLSTGWDLTSTLGKGNTYSPSNGIAGLGISSDGKILYLAEGTNEEIEGHALTTAYDISTASLQDTFNIDDLPIATTIDYLCVTSDDREIYFDDGGGGRYRLFMKTAADVTTSVLTGEVNTGSTYMNIGGEDKRLITSHLDSTIRYVNIR